MTSEEALEVFSEGAILGPGGARGPLRALKESLSFA